MSEDKFRALQMRLGKRTAEPFKEWYDKQASPNDAGRRAMEHFIRLYGTADIDSDEVQISMAKDLIMSRGVILETKTELPEINHEQDDIVEEKEKVEETRVIIEEETIEAEEQPEPSPIREPEKPVDPEPAPEPTPGQSESKEVQVKRVVSRGPMKL